MMALVNQAAMEALCAATYLENYLDCMDNLPDDLQRVVSELRELDSAANEIINDIAANQALYIKEEDIHKKKKALAQVHRYLIKSQEIGDEKLRLVATMSEFIENRTRQLEQDLENLGISKKPRLDPTLGEGKEEKEKKSELRLPKPIAAAMRLPSPVQPSPPLSVQSTPTVNNAMNIITQQTNHGKSSSMSTVVTPPAAASSIAAESKQDTPVSSAKQNKRQRRQRNAEISKQEEEKQKEEEEKMQPKKKKKRKAKKTGDKSFEKTLIGEPIDPDEPTYCLCGQVSYGDMIGCDNDNCAIEWFHFNCVGLHSKPKGKWYCPKCRGDKPNIKRSDLK